MLVARKKQEGRSFNLVGNRRGEVAFHFSLDRKKMLIGSFPGADISISDPHVSHYHAFIIVDENGGKIIDLASDNGIYVNGERVQQSFFGPGDSLRIGTVELVVEEAFGELLDQDDGKVVAVEESQILAMQSELPPIPGLVVVDGEYCDIVFDEEAFSPLTHVPAFEGPLDFSPYVDYEEEKKVDPIARESKNQAIEVLVLSMGHMISVDYLPVKNKTFYFSSKGKTRNAVHLPTLPSDDECAFLKISRDEITLMPVEGLGRFVIGDRREIDSNSEISLKNQTLCYHIGSVQVMVRGVTAPPQLKNAPFFGRDREFQKEVSKVFSALMGIMLLILFIDTTVEPPPKKIAVIYRQAVESPVPSHDKSSEQTSDRDTDKGVKKTEQEPKETKMAKAQEKPVTKPQPEKVEAPAAAAAPAPKAPTSAEKLKGYKLDLKNSLASLASSSKDLAPVTGSSSESSLSTDTGIGSLKSKGSTELKQNQGTVGSLGQDAKGSFDSSSGAKGLASKHGIDTAFADAKTVVLGSMDPELLRKILQEYLPQFRHCYQQELARNEGVKGVLDLNFRIEANGQVSKIDVKGKSASFGTQGSGCMAQVLRVIEFPRPKGGGVVDVRQPLNFFAEKDRI
jgi:pSer/pThr/pTyr-binding forkhead associated (FHA) protein/outer membrane biosynthesis protein TonB